MDKKHIRFFFILFLVLLSCFQNSNGEAIAGGQPDQPLLDSLKKADDLENWTYVWSDFFATENLEKAGLLKKPQEEVWRSPQTKAEKEAWFYLLTGVGYYSLKSGDILLSIEAYEEAWALFQSGNFISKEDALEYVFKPLGNNYTRLGDHHRALYVQREGLKLAQELGNRSQQASILNNLAITSRWAGDKSRALKFADEGLTLAPASSAIAGLLYSTKADILFTNERWEEAEQNIRKAILILKTPERTEDRNGKYWLASAYQVAASIHFKTENYSAALSDNRSALHVFDQFPSSMYRREKAKIRLSLGQLFHAEGKVQEAIKAYDQSLQLLLPSFDGATDEMPSPEQLFAENTLMDALIGKALALHTQNKKDPALENYRLAFLVAEKLRNTIFSEESRRALQKETLRAAEDAIRLSLERYEQSQQKAYAELALSFMEQYKSQLLLDELKRNSLSANGAHPDSLQLENQKLVQAISYYKTRLIEATLSENKKDSLQWKEQLEATEYKLSLLEQERKISPGGWMDSPQEKQKDLNERIKELPSQTVVWEYFTGPTDWFLISLTKDGIKDFVRLGDAKELERQTDLFVEEWFLNGATAMRNRPEDYFREAFELYSKLTPDKVVLNEHLLLIPDGILGKLPFEALLTDSDFIPNPAHWPYFMKATTLSQVYSLSIFDILQQEGNMQKRGVKKGFFGFFYSPKSKDLSELKGVEKEAENIQKYIGGNFYLSQKATSASFKEALPQAEILHISTHAFLLGEQEIPALEMADARVYLSEIAHSSHHPDLIFLGACQSANGLLSPTEGVISLARKFSSIGAGGVIAGLWDLNDETTAILTGLFYKNLRESGDKVTALKKAKIAWLSDPTLSAEKKLPYYWAGLVYLGNLRSLSQPLQVKAKNSLYLLLSSTGLLLALFFFWRYKKTGFGKHSRQ